MHASRSNSALLESQRILFQLDEGEDVVDRRDQDLRCLFECAMEKPCALCLAA